MIIHKMKKSFGIWTGKGKTQRKKQFSIGEFLLLLFSKLPYVILAALLGTMLSLYYSRSVLAPLYTATAKLYVLGQEKIDRNLISVRAGTLLAIDYQEVFQTWEIQEEVEASLGSEGCQEIQPDRLSIENPEGTRVLYISYTCEDPQLAAKTANAYALAGQKFMLGTMPVQQPLLFSEAIPPSERASMGQKGFAAMGFLWGTAFAVWIFFMKFTFDDHPHRPEDIEAAAGIPTLAIIPKSQRLPGVLNNKRQR